MPENWTQTLKAFILSLPSKFMQWLLPQVHSPNEPDKPLTLIEIIGLLAGAVAIAAAFQR